MTKKIANIRWFTRDWKDHIKGSDLAKAIKEVEKCGHGSKVIDSAVNTNSDDYVTFVVPEYYNLDTLDESVDQILGYATAAHIAKDGSLWFKFNADCGMPATNWLNLKDSLCWSDGMGASDELNTNKHLDKSEKAEFQSLKAKALKIKYR